MAPDDDSGAAEHPRDDEAGSTRREQEHDRLALGECTQVVRDTVDAIFLEPSCQAVGTARQLTRCLAEWTRFRAVGHVVELTSRVTQRRRQATRLRVSLVLQTSRRTSWPTLSAFSFASCATALTCSTDVSLSSWACSTA